jgi:SpoVK/Ycf46/Vps4 family AAA+-type ATPase
MAAGPPAARLNMDRARNALPPGVLSMHVLPAEHHDKDWDAIIVPREVKERLLAQALLVLEHGRQLGQLSGLPHGLIVLAGPPGTGKTTMGRGLAQVAALALARKGATTLLEVNPHAFPSDMLGESQRNVTRLLADTIPEIAARRPFTVVLIDEVESFAVRRSSASFEANPVDVHRATDAVLLGIDEVARKLPSVLFVTTTNFIEAVDEAFLSRADLVMRFALPDRDTIVKILASALTELAVQFPPLAPLSLRRLGWKTRAETCARRPCPKARRGARPGEAHARRPALRGAQERRRRVGRRHGTAVARVVPRCAESAHAGSRPWPRPRTWTSSHSHAPA